MDAQTPRHGPPLPAFFPSETILSAQQLAAVVGISLGWLMRLVDLGLVECTAPGTQEFTVASARRLEWMLRLNRMLGLHWTDAAELADLVEGVDPA